MAQFVIREKSTKPSFADQLPNATEFAKDHPFGTEADFGDGVVYVLTAPRDCSWQPKRGRAAGSTNSTKATAGPETAPESKPEKPAK
jgi:hypothetical protein